ncbi:MAG: hypothetical protein WA160_03450 [Pseudobdellovibrio sp.]
MKHYILNCPLNNLHPLILPDSFITPGSSYVNKASSGPVPNLNVETFQSLASLTWKTEFSLVDD